MAEKSALKIDNLVYVNILIYFVLAIDFGAFFSGAFVCRHHDGYWNTASGDKFGEQTEIKMGKGALKLLTLSAEYVTEWINAFPITVHVADSMDTIYFADPSEQSAEKKHTEKLKHMRVLDAYDRERIAAVVDKYPAPLEDNRLHLYNPVTGEVATAEVNVANSLTIREQMTNNYIVSLPKGLYSPISRLL